MSALLDAYKTETLNQSKILKFNNQCPKCPKQCLIPPAGFVVQAYEFKENEHIRKSAEMQFEKGIHIWEIIPWHDSKELSIGVVTETGKYVVSDFTTTTFRIITVQLNLNDYVMDFYLNSNHNEKKRQTLEKGMKYSPAVIFKAQGKLIALNPFAQHPLCQYPRIVPLPLDLFKRPENFPWDQQDAPLQLIAREGTIHLNLEPKLRVGRNFIFQYGEKYKLIRTKEGSHEATKFQLLAMFENDPRLPNDLVTLKIIKTQFDVLQANWRWTYAMKMGCLTQELLEKFLQSECTVFDGIVCIKVEFIVAKQIIVSQLLAFEEEFALIFQNPQSKPVETFKILQIVSSLLNLDEQLQYEDGELYQTMQKSQFSTVAKICSQYQRLHTFLDSANYPLHILDLVQLGLMKYPGFKPILVNFTSYLFPLEPITNPYTVQDILPKEQILKFLDVPLDVTINSLNPLRSSGQIVQRSPDSIFLSLLDNKNQLSIYNVELEFNLQFKVDLREYKKAAEAQPEPQDVFGGLFNDNEADKPDPGTEDQPEQVVPNEDLLGQLYTMGFTLEVAKQALIETKNNIDNAVELAVQIQQKKQKEQPQVPKTKQLKLQWECVSCTFVNTNNENSQQCAMCEALPPESAYVKEDPPQPIQSPESVQDCQNEQIEPPKSAEQQAESEEKKKEQFFREAQITHVSQMDQQNEILIGAGYQFENKNLLVLRRVQYCKSYLQNFVKQSKDNNSYFSSYLTNTYYHEIVTHLEALTQDQNSRFIFQTLYPVRNKVQNIFELTDIIEIPQESKVQNVCIFDKLLYVFLEDQIKLYTLFQNTVFSPTLLKAVPINWGTVESSIVVENRLFVSASCTLYELDSNQTIIKVLEAKGVIRSLQFQDGSLLIQANDKQTIKISRNLNDFEEQLEPPAQLLEDEKLDLTSLNASEIQDLAKLIETRLVYFKAKYDGSYVYQNPAYNHPLYSSIIISPQPGPNEIILELDKASKLIDIELSAYTDFKYQPKLHHQYEDSISPESIIQLPLTLFTHKGSQFNNQQIISKTFFVQQDPFSTLYPRPFFIYKHLQRKRMNITSYTVASPIPQNQKVNQVGVSLASGLVFLADNPNDFAETYKFRYFNRALYEEWKQARAQDPKPLKPWEPVSYFELQTESLTVQFESPKMARYIMMMSLSARKLENQKTFDTEPLIYTYFVVKGSIVKNEDRGSIYQRCDEVSELFDFEVYFDGKRTQDFETSYGLDLFKSREPNVYQCQLQILHLNPVKQIKIVYKNKHANFLQVQAHKQKEITPHLLQKIPNAYHISSLMHDVEKYELYNKQMMSLIHNKMVSFPQRLSCIKVMCNLLRTNSQQIQKCYADFNYLTYLQLNLLTQNKKEQESVQRFLYFFSQMPDFQEKLQESIFFILNTLFQTDMEINPAGFVQLLILLKQLAQHNPTLLFPYILTQLEHVIKFTSKLEVKIWSNQLNEMGFYNICFDSNLFSERYANILKRNGVAELQPANSQELTSLGSATEKQDVQSTVITHKKEINSTIQYRQKIHCDEFIVQFHTKYNVDGLQLYFKHTDPPLPCILLRIQLFYENQCLIDVAYSDYMAFQLTKYGPHFKNQFASAKLNMLRFPIAVQNAQCFKVQVSYSQNVLQKHKDESSIAKDLAIIPQFTGTLCSDTIEGNEIAGAKLEKSNFQFDNTLSYKQYLLDGTIFLLSFGPLPTNRTYPIQQAHKQQQEVCPESENYLAKLKQLLRKTQAELKDKMKKNNPKEVQQQVANIQKLYQEILKHESLHISSFSQSQDFLFTYAYELIDILITTDSANKSWRSSGPLMSQEGLRLAQLLYQTFAISEQGPLTTITINLLNVLLENLNLKSWVTFCFSQYKRIAEPNVLNSLKSLKIPISQTICYIRNTTPNKELLELVIHRLRVNSQFTEKELLPMDLQKLKPPGMERSTSSQEADQNDFDELLEQCQDLTKSKVLLLAFDIMSWTLQNDPGLFGLSCDLFLIIPDAEMPQFVQQITNKEQPIQSSIISLISNAILSNDLLIQKKLKEFLDKIILNSIPSCKVIFYTLANLLTALFEYADKLNQLKIQKMSSSVWFTFISFIVSQLLQMQQQIKPTIQRKKSLPTKQQISNSFQDFADRADEGIISICQVETVIMMMKYIISPPKNLTNFDNLSQSLNYWGLLMNLIQRMRPQQILDNKIYDDILSIFIKLDQFQQESLLSRFIEMTKQILDYGSYSDFNQILLKIVLENPDGLLMKALLNLLAQKERKLNAKSFKMLFPSCATYLIRSCNIGRNDGVLNCELPLLSKLQTGNRLLTLLLKSDYNIKVQTSMLELQDFGAIINKFIHWYMLNKFVNQTVSPATELLQNLSKNVRLIFEWVTQDSALVTEAMHQLYSFQRTLDHTLQESTSGLPNHVHFSLVRCTQEIFEELNELWMVSDAVVREVAIYGKGFEYLLEKTHLTKGNAQIENIQIEGMPEEEFGSKLTLFEPNGQKSTITTKDWQMHKKGVKTRVHTVTMKDDLYDEYPLDFQLDKPIELKNIRIGLQVYTPEFTDKVLGLPSSIVVEVRNKQQDTLWYPIGIMQNIEDEAYTFYSVKVMSLNLDRINTSKEDLGSQIRSLCQQPVTWIRFVLKRPQITLMEHISQLSFKQFNQIQIGISFVSINGYDTENNSKMKQLQIIQEQTASRLLGKMCAQKFRNTLSDISQNLSIIEQIQRSFENVSKALQTNEGTLAPLFIGLTKYNPDFGDWVLNQLLDIKQECAHAKLSAEIVLQDRDRQQKRLNKFLEFVLHQIEQIDSIVGNTQLLQQLTFFVEALTFTIGISAKHLNEKRILNVDQRHLLSVIHAIQQTSQQYYVNIFIKLLITIVYIPTPYTTQNVDAVAITNELWHYYSQKQVFSLRTLAGMIQISELAQKFIIERYDQIIQDAMDVLEVVDNSLLTDYFFFLDSSANIPEINTICRQKGYQIQIYDALKVKNPSKQLLKSIDQITIQYIVSFIGKVAIQDQTSIIGLAEKLIQDIPLLSVHVDIAYVESILMPLLNFEQKAEFTVDIWDKESSQFVGDLRKLSNKLQTDQDDEEPTRGQLNELNGFTFREFTSQYYDALLTSIQKVLKSNSLRKGGKWVKEFEASQGGNYFNDVLSLLQKGPFLIVLSGKNGNSGENAIVGLFSTQKCGSLVDKFSHDYYPAEVYPIIENGEQFGFTYEKQRIYHLLNNDRRAFGVGMDHENGGSFSFLLERLTLTFCEEQQEIATVQIGIHDFELLEQKPEEDFYFEEFWMQRMEVWTYQQPQQVAKGNKASMLNQLYQKINQSVSQSTFGYGIMAQGILLERYINKNSVNNYLSPTPIYALPATANASNVLQTVRVSTLSLSDLAITENKAQLNLKGELKGILKKPFNNLTVDGIELLQHLTSTSEQTLQYHATLPIFDSFQKQDGVKQIILAVTNATKTWQNQELTQIWSQYVSELNAFCSVPQFFSYFLKNKQSMELLFQLLAGIPDSGDAQIWKDKEMEAVKFIYDTLSDVFKTFNNQEIRIIAINENLIQKILDRIAIVSKEKKRTFKPQEEEEDAVETQVQKQRVAEKPAKKKQGVGYGSDQMGQNQKWNTQEYIDKKKQRSEQLKSLLEIIKNFFSYEHWHLNQDLAHKINTMIFESALLPLLEGVFRSGSLLEMSKDSDLTLCYLQLTKTLAKHKNLAPLLMKIPTNYVPRQIESVDKLLANLTKTAQIFLSCVKQDDSNESNQTSKLIAQVIVETDAAVQDAISKFQQNMSDEGDQSEDEPLQGQEDSAIKEILSKPLAEAYRLLLKDLRFDYISFKNANNQYQHFNERQIVSAPAPTPAKLIRLAQEFADMSNSLPVEHTNAIFVRADKDRVDVIKALVMGASGTPYAHGAYLFDIYFDESYPNSPPKMNLSTTGNSKIRFNPNLYACGKVCLSLLGTWRGHASENWDPKLSTLLQVLVSTQSIIMSEDVYFNEPGFEGEANTPEGESKNEGYSNIVRYGNIQYAIIDQIKNPPPGFEQIIRRHFFLKQDEIMEEVKKWVDYAQNKNALYVGLVQDHNSTWCTQFKKSKGAYLELLKTAVADLEKALKSLQPPKIIEIGKLVKRKKKKAAKQEEFDSVTLNLEEVDVTYDKEQKQLELDVNREEVKDRWSRYIGAMGIDAVKKQAAAKVFLSGLGPLGVEIAKNIILSGVNSFYINDNTIVREEDLIGQFFLEATDVGKKRGECSLAKLQQLNNYVVVRVLDSEVQQSLMKESVSIVVLTDVYGQDELVCWSNFCRMYNIKLIVANVDGVFARVLNDFGKEFTILDKDGEELPDVVIKSISSEEQGKVQLIDGQKCQFQDGDMVRITHVEGMIDKEGKSINGTVHKIKKQNISTFFIEDTRDYSPYIRSGIAQHVKQSVQIINEPIDSVIKADLPFDKMLQITDYMKINESIYLHQFYKILSQTINFRELPNLDQILIDRATKQEGEPFKLDQLPYYAKVFARQVLNPGFPPLAAYIGGVVAQEIIKAITNKFTPINQAYYTDCVEVLPYPMFNPKEPLEQQLQILQPLLTQNEPTVLKSILGPDLVEKLEKTTLFMVGCGAIGCELLKNIAMLNVGVKGLLTITDPDHIETSNLNRQFLFREKHIHKPKSQIAAAAIVQMNPKLKNHVNARMEKVFEGTEHIFNDRFFESLSLVANALDNVQARRYVDRRCVATKRPLLESGTLGPKGHVQCIIPYITESYGSQSDPAEEGDIPYCTLKMFPEETLHCVEFARDKFGKLFSLNPKAAQKLMEGEELELKQLRDSLKLLEGKPNNYNDCIRWARGKYEKYFVNDIKQLLYTYPPETKTRDGQPFWRLPKRPPKVIDFDPKNEMCINFISTLAYLRAQIYGIAASPKWRTKEERAQAAEIASQYQVKQWQPNEEKKREIEEQVHKQEGKPIQQEQEEETNAAQVSEAQEREALIEKAKALQKGLKLAPQEFEKDQDSNGHIDFMHAFGNLRAANYELPEMDWITVKLKAGRIVPALATTTAAIAGLQTIELVKIIKNTKVEHMKNAFVNLAIPMVQLTEPGACQKIKLNEHVSVTLWDRWEVREVQTLREMFEQLGKRYQMEPVNVFHKSAAVYCEDLVKSKPQEKEKLLGSKLTELLEADDSYVDLVVNFVQEGQLVQNVPEIRVFLK